MTNKLTIAHVTHEAVEKVGGIGTVLEGQLTSPAYQREVGRTIMVGASWRDPASSGPADRLAAEGTILYDGRDGTDRSGHGVRLAQVERTFGVEIVYGTRPFAGPGDDRTGEAEVLLIDVSRLDRECLDRFKFVLHEQLGLDSRQFEADWGYEEWVRLAPPAIRALEVLLDPSELPCVIVAHEFMGLPTAFHASLLDRRSFRTVYVAHECPPARQAVEGHPGHDTWFYNLLREARRKERPLDDLNGEHPSSFRHALVRCAHVCDAALAVGDFTAEELLMFAPKLDPERVEVVYNGLPAIECTSGQRHRCRKMLTDYAGSLIGWRPDVLLTHVTRPVISKGLWRDARLCHELDRHFGEAGLKGALFLLTSAAGTRTPEQVRTMAGDYGWPRRHREGYPDLLGPEVELNRMMEIFNAEHEHVQMILVNQFGWSRSLVGPSVPDGMTFTDLRRAADVEVGMATYEPFGISPLEPLGAGTLCLVSSISGCLGFVDQVTLGRGAENVIVCDFTRLAGKRTDEELLAIAQDEREAVEQLACAAAADEIMQRLPRDDAGREALLESGQALARQLGWDVVVEQRLMPVLQRISGSGARNGPGRRAVSPCPTGPSGEA